MAQNCRFWIFEKNDPKTWFLNFCTIESKDLAGSGLKSSI